MLSKKFFLTGLVVIFFLLFVVGLRLWWFPKFVVENQQSQYHFRASSLQGAVYLWKVGYWPELKTIKVIYTSDQQHGYLLKSGTTDQVMMSMSAEKTATIVTVNIPVFNRCFIFTKLCSIIDA